MRDRALMGIDVKASGAYIKPLCGITESVIMNALQTQAAPIISPGHQPEVMPIYTKFARLVDGHGLIIKAGLSHVNIATASGHHTNTVSAKLRGGRGTYIIVNDIFTSINKLSGNAFDRHDYLEIFDEKQQSFVKDPALSMCAVFPRFAALLSEIKRDPREFGNECHVKTMFVTHIKLRRPTSINLVQIVFDHLNQHYNKALIHEEEIIK